MDLNPGYMDKSSSGVLPNFGPIGMPTPPQTYNNHLMPNLAVPLRSYLPLRPLGIVSNPSIPSSQPVPQPSCFPSVPTPSYPLQLQGSGVFPYPTVKPTIQPVDPSALSVVGAQAPSIAFPTGISQQPLDPSAAITMYRRYYTDVLAYFKNLLDNMDHESKSTDTKVQSATTRSAKVSFLTFYNITF